MHSVLLLAIVRVVGWVGPSVATIATSVAACTTIDASGKRLFCFLLA